MLAVVVTGPGALDAAGAVWPHRADAAKAGGAVERDVPVARPKLDRSGRKRVGTASVYARRFAGRKMADGARMDPHDDNAASKTLPLGTEAKVTNLKTGRAAPP